MTYEDVTPNFSNFLSRNISAERLDQNIAAYDIGQGMIKSSILYNTDFH